MAEVDVRPLTTEELRRSKPDRQAFREQLRSPIFVVLDGVRQGYNIGAVFRLCDAFLVQHLTICQARRDFCYKKRSLVSAAAGTQGWVPWSVCSDAAEAVRALKSAGVWISAVEQTTASVIPRHATARFPLALILGGERDGISKSVIALADETISIPMRGMANSLNVSTAAAIVLHEMACRHEGFLP